jgi:small subunit ribosomal protein S16
LATRIRLKRIGATKNPHYKLVVSDSESPRDGRVIEIIGHYNARAFPESVIVQTDRARYWLSQGATPTPAAKKVMMAADVYKADSKPVQVSAEA